MQLRSDEVYAGFWVRLFASLIDTVLLLLVTVPLTYAIYGDQMLSMQQQGAFMGGWDFIINFILPAVVIVLFWRYRAATPGKMLLKIRVVDAESGEPMSVGQSVGRYFAYIVSTLPLLLGFVWVAFDKRKQGFHDKLAGSCVVQYKGEEFSATHRSGIGHARRQQSMFDRP